MNEAASKSKLSTKDIVSVIGVSTLVSAHGLATLGAAAAAVSAV
jgi:hypothetical protein